MIGARDVYRRAEELSAALQASGARTLLCPEADNRAMLRWTMDLLPSDIAVAVFVDSDGRLTSSHATALDPAIPAIAWPDHTQNVSQFTQLIPGSAVLVSFAQDAKSLAQTIIPWLRAGHPASSDASALSPKTETLPAADSPATSNGNHESTSATPSLASSTYFDDRDRAVLQELERQMASALKTKVKNEPIQIQQPGLDFSIAMRALMTAGRSLAHKNSHPKVLGAHYLTSLDEPWRSALADKGLTSEAALDYLSSLDSESKSSGEPIVSDEVFDAVTRAKEQAREKHHPCVRVCDFLIGLLLVNSGNMTALLDRLHLTSEDLVKTITDADPGDEPCAEPFFKPSSMDQAGFYEFDASEVRNLTERLRELPAFQKAAERVAESRSRQGRGPFDNLDEESKPGVTVQPLKNQISVPPPPPAKPEILQVKREFPPVDVVENMADLLLEGHIIAFPADVMLATAVDAANSMAVDNLRDAASLPADRPVSVLINSTSQLKHLVKEDVDALEPLLDEFWPGPLTLIFNAATGAVKHLSGSGTIAVRQPADNVSLSILSMLGRPLAVTSWDKEPSSLAGYAAAVIEGEHPPASIRTTVVDISVRPWKIIREGPVPGHAVMRFYQSRQ